MSLKNLEFNNHLKLFILILFFCFLEVGVLPYFFPLRIRPSLFLVIISMVGMNLGLTQTVLLAIFCGALRDVFAVRFFGLNTVSFSIFAVLIYFTSRKIFIETYGVKYVLLFIFTILYYTVLSFALGRPYILIGLPEAILNCLVLAAVNRFFIFYART